MFEHLSTLVELWEECVANFPHKLSKNCLHPDSFEKQQVSLLKTSSDSDAD
eukprot:Awhi_evm1s877